MMTPEYPQTPTPSLWMYLLSPLRSTQRIHGNAFEGRILLDSHVDICGPAPRTLLFSLTIHHIWKVRLVFLYITCGLRLWSFLVSFANGIFFLSWFHFVLMEFDKDSNVIMPFCCYVYPTFPNSSWFKLFPTLMFMKLYSPGESMGKLHSFHGSMQIKMQGHLLRNYCESHDDNSRSWSQAGASLKPRPCDCTGDKPMKLALLQFLSVSLISLSGVSSNCSSFSYARQSLSYVLNLLLSLHISPLATSPKLIASTLTKIATNLLCYAYLWTFSERIGIPWVDSYY